MTVHEKNAAATATHRENTCHFCATGRKHAFEKDPEKYVSASAAHTGH